MDLIPKVDFSSNILKRVDGLRYKMKRVDFHDPNKNIISLTPRNEEGGGPINYYTLFVLFTL